jgi:hypothetical protein
MNTKHHVSQTIAKQLAEAGIVIESEYYWHTHDGKNWVCDWRNFDHRTVPAEFQVFPAPIATEILERLPKYLTDEDDMNWHLNISYDDYNTPYLSYQLNEMEWFNAVTADTAPNALALLLIRLTKDGLI